MENIIKQGYLKKAKPIAADSPRSNICSSLLQFFESSRWYIFVVRNGRPYLDVFEKEQHAFSGQPMTTHELSSCYKITYTLGRTSKTWTFCIFLEERIVELTAESRDQMLDWCGYLERTLVHYGKVKQNTEHVYVDYPVKYTPKKTGLEQEQALEASALPSSHVPCHAPTQSVINDPTDEEYQDFIDLIHHIDDDDDDSDEDQNNVDKSIVKFVNDAGAHDYVPEIPPKSTDYLAEPQGAVGGLPARTGKVSDTEFDTSEDDFVNADFWLSNKLPSVPRSQDINPSASARPLSECIAENSMFASAPALPTRVKCLSEKRLTFISSAFEPDLKAPPRRKRSGANIHDMSLRNSASKSVSEDNVSDRSPLATMNVDDYEDLDDGYDNVLELRKSNSDSATTDPWVRSLENNGTNVRNSTLKAPDDAQLFVDLPLDGCASGESLKTPTPDDGFDGDWVQKLIQRSLSEEHYINVPSENDLESDSATASVKQMMLETKDENFNLCDIKIASNIYDFGKSYVITKEPVIVRAENIYDFARSEGTLVHTPITSQPSPPQRSSMVIHPPAFAASGPTEFSEFDSLYSIPKSSKPVAGLSTEEVLRPARPPKMVLEPCPDFYSVPQKQTTKSHSSSSVAGAEPSTPLYSVPQKKTSKSHSSSSMEESCDNSKSTTTPKTKSMDSFLAPKLPSLDTLPSVKPPSLEKLSSPPLPSLDSLPLQEHSTVTSPPARQSPIAMRPLPSLPTDANSPDDSQTNKLSSTKSERATSPSHDGFMFNFVTDTVDAASKSSTSSSGSGASKDENAEPVYEDATGRNNPPLPPRRTIRRNTNRSVSVYIPGKTGGTRTTRLDPGPTRCESVDDEMASRHKVGRQISLTERQQIRQSSSSIVVIPLKQSQVDLLCEEQKLHGVALDISHKSAHAIALIEKLNGVWIAGWDGRRFPRLAEKIHIGDQLLSVEDVRVTSAVQATKLLKQTRSERITFVIKRLPYASILAIRRNHDGENLGITREGGTAEITYVDPNGLMARCGLQKRAKIVDGLGECNWMLTEINSRSLNFSFKGEEIERLLNAVGRDISAVLQPVDFVKSIKKHLKKLKNYKEYLY